MNSTYSNLVKLYELMVVQNYAKEQERTKRSRTRTVKIGNSVCCVVCRGQDNLVKLRYESDPNSIIPEANNQDIVVENYIEMVFDCFNIEILDEDGGGCICEACIGRLRDALDFKRCIENAENLLHQTEIDNSPGGETMEVDEAIDRKQTKKNKTKSSVVQDTVEILPPRLKTGTNQCPVCQEYHFNSGALKTHYMSHFYPEHACSECGKTYLTGRQLNQHVRTYHKNAQHVCQACGKIYTTARSLDEHVRKVHEQSKAYQCEYCPESFATQDDRRKHKMKCHKEHCDSYSCHMCDKTFYSVSGQRYHIRTVHMGVKQFSCSECDYKCASVSVLERHKSVHTIPSIECSLCGKLFKTYSALMEHMKMHTEGKTHKCQYCDASFVQAKTLTSHLIKKHKIHKRDRDATENN